MIGFDSLRTSVGRKVWVALTGFFLCLFLVVHLAGNLALLLPPDEARLTYNAYSAFLVGNPIVKILAYLVYASIVAHAALSAFVAVRNRRAAGRPRYACDRPSLTSPWFARHMGALGLCLLAFLVIHMKTFWFTYHWGDVPLDDRGNKDLYAVVTEAFARPWYVGLYVLCMGALALHLFHGLPGALRTVGMHHPRYAPLLRRAAMTFAIVVSVAFAALPIWVHLRGGE